MSREKEEAVIIYIMLVSVLKMIDMPNKKVSKLTRGLFNGLRRMFLKSQKNSSVRIAAPKYVELNDMVIEAWDTARAELVDKKKPLDSSLSELIQTLYDRMNRNSYQNLFLSERRIVEVINSIRNCPTNEYRTEEEITKADNNARKLSFRFLELCGIKKQHNLATRKKIIEQNIIIERG